MSIRDKEQWKHTDLRDPVVRSSLAPTSSGEAAAQAIFHANHAVEMAPCVDPDSGSFITQGIAEQPGRAALPLRTPAEAGLIGEAGAGAAVGAGQAGGAPKASDVDQDSAASGR